MLHTGLATPDVSGIHGPFLGAPGTWPGPTPAQTGRVWHLARCPGCSRWLQTGELCPCVHGTWAFLTPQGLARTCQWHMSKSFKSYFVVLPLLFYLGHEASIFQKGATSTHTEGHQGLGL